MALQRARVLAGGGAVTGAAGTPGGEAAVASPVGPADVTIVVPVGGSTTAWPRAARSLGRLSPPPGETIAVLDRAGPAAAAAAAANGAIVIASPRRGPAAARNAGAAAARGAVLLFVDADVEVPADLVGQVSAFFTAHPGVDALIGSYDDDPAGEGVVSRYRNLLHHYVHQTASADASTFWAGCGAVRREVFAAAGGFDERFTTPSVEDIELGARLVDAGRRVRLDRSLQVKHLKVWRLADVLATDLWRRAVPWTELMLRRRALINDLNVKTKDRASVALAFIACGALAAAVVAPALLAMAGGSVLLIVVLNAGFFRFLRRRGGLALAAAAVPLYWLYLLVCGGGFGIGLLRLALPSRRP